MDELLIAISHKSWTGLLLCRTIELLLNLPKLRHLNLTVNKLECDLSILRRHPTLEQIKFHGYVFNHIGWASLFKLPQLQSLEVYQFCKYCEGTDDYRPHEVSHCSWWTYPSSRLKHLCNEQPLVFSYVESVLHLKSIAQTQLICTSAGKWQCVHKSQALRQCCIQLFSDAHSLQTCSLSQNFLSGVSVLPKTS